MLWNHISKIFELRIGFNFESIACWWVSNNKNSVLNTVGAALPWSIWKLRNEFCFQGKIWKDERKILTKTAQALKNWKPLCKAGSMEKYNWVISKIMEKSRDPLKITGGSLVSGSTASSTSALPPSKLGVSRETSSVIVENLCSSSSSELVCSSNLLLNAIESGRA